MTGARELRRFSGLLTAFLALVAAAGCSSGRYPDTGGLEPERFLARFSGEWALDRNASDDPGGAVEAYGGGGVRGGGQGGGGQVAGQRGGGAFRGGGRQDQAALATTFGVFRAVRNRFTLTVTDSLVVTTWAGGDEARIPVAGDAFPINFRGQSIEAKAKWDGERLRLERRVDGGGTIVDLVEILAEGDRLLLTRTVRGVPLTVPEIRLVFDRTE